MEDAELFRLLQLLRPAMRHLVVSRHVTQARRLRLEQWILAHRHNKGATGKLASDTDVEAMPTKSNDQGAASISEPSPHGSTGHAGRRPPRSGVRGVQTRLKCGRRSYCASMNIGPLLVSTKYHPEFSMALRFHEVLVAIHRRCGAQAASAMIAGGETIDGFISSFRGAVAEAPPLFNLDAFADMDLRFAVLVPAKYWVGTIIKTPQFSARQRLDAGLRALQDLFQARGLVFRGRTNMYTILAKHSPEELQAAWQQLRAVYLDVWAAECGDQARRQAVARLAALEQKHLGARQRLLHRWHCSRGPKRKMPDRRGLPGAKPMTEAVGDGSACALKVQAAYREAAPVGGASATPPPTTAAAAPVPGAPLVRLLPAPCADC